MLVVLSIVGILGAVLLTQFASFDSELLLRNRAYEIALAIREAQVLGVSVRGGDVDVSGQPIFTSRYGVHIDTAPTTQYILFRDRDLDFAYDVGEAVTTYIIDGRHRISDFCSTTAPAAEDCTIPRLDIIFKRPDPDALINKPSSAASGASSARIIVESTRTPGNFRDVVVSSTGQISIQ